MSQGFAKEFVDHGLLTGLTDDDHTQYVLESAVAWTTWSPTYTNLTVGNGTVTARYVQIEKTIHAYYSLTFGSTSAVSGDVGVSLPVAASASYIAATAPVGTAMFLDSGTARYNGTVSIAATGFLVRAEDVATYVRQKTLSSTAPFVWTTSDVLAFSATYEAA